MASSSNHLDFFFFLSARTLEPTQNPSEPCWFHPADRLLSEPTTRNQPGFGPQDPSQMHPGIPGFLQNRLDLGETWGQQNSPGSGLLGAPPSVALSALRKQLGGGAGRDAGPQAEDAFPLLHLLPTQKPGDKRPHVSESNPPEDTCPEPGPKLEVTQFWTRVHSDPAAYLLLYLLRASSRCCPLSAGGLLDS